jgi:hypothetical protein
MNVLCLLLACFCLVSTCAFGQLSLERSVSVTNFSSVLIECESNECTSLGENKGTWVFHGSTGDAHWPDGAVAKLVVERFDQGRIAIRRIDLPTSSSWGLTALYTGTMQGNHIEGTVVWYWNGHWGGRHPSAPWTATVEKHLSAQHAAPAVQIPSSLIECEGNQCSPGRSGGCVWVFHGVEGEGQCRGGAVEKLLIQQADAENIVIRRTDLPHSGSYGLTGVYVGTLHGDRLTGYVTWSWPGHWENRNPSAKWFAFAAATDTTHPALPPIPPPLVSPEVLADRRVTFRFLDPNALEVFLELEGFKPTMMQKDEVGIWSATTPPLPLGPHGYQFRADDVVLVDPSNPVLVPNAVLPKSMVRVEGEPAADGKQ